jgi:hypothetical protein
MISPTVYFHIVSCEVGVDNHSGALHTCAHADSTAGYSISRVVDLTLLTTRFDFLLSFLTTRISVEHHGV